MYRIFTRIFLSLLFVGISSLSLRAQAVFGIHASFQPRVGTIASSDYRNAVGLGFEFLSPNVKKASPVSLQFGAQFTALYAGEERVDALISPAQGIEGELTISNKQISLHGITRITPQNTKWILPYADFLVGMGVYGIEEMVDDHSYDEAVCEIVNTQVNFEVGVAGGLMIPLSNTVFLDIRGTYLNTGRVPFANLSTVRVNEGIADYQIDTIRPDLFNLKVGVIMAVDGWCW